MPVKINVGRPNSPISIEVIGETPVAAWRMAAAMSTIARVTECGECGSDDLYPDCRAAVKKDGGEFDAYKIRCGKCGSNLSLGLNKEGGGMYLKWDTEWFVPAKKDEAPATAGAIASGEVKSDIPF